MALLQYAGEYATDSLQWAVSEAQRCFQAPLDHTRHGPVEPLPELVNKPTGNPYFDRMLKSETGLKFLELADSRNNPSTAPECKDSAFASCLSVVVVKQDGTRSQHSISMSPSGDDGPPPSVEDTLTKRSSPDVVAAALQSIFHADGGAAQEGVNNQPPSAVDAAARSAQVESAPPSLVESIKAEVNQQIGPMHENHAELAGSEEDDWPTVELCESDFLNLVEFSRAEIVQPAKEMHHLPEDTTRWKASYLDDGGILMESENTNCEEQEQDSNNADCQPESRLVEDMTGQAKELRFVEDELPEAAHTLQGIEERCAWQTGSIVEVFSGSNNSWFPALVTQTVRRGGPKDLLTAQFWLDIESAKQKTLCREDPQLASLGTNCGDMLPPGFQIAMSKSRPGVFVFLDATTGLKYESMELIWAVHFKRWLEHPAPAGTQTISCVKAAISRADTFESPPALDGLDAEAAGLVTRLAPGKLPTTVEWQGASPAKPSVTCISAAEKNAAPSSDAFLDAMAMECPGPYCSNSAAMPRDAEDLDQASDDEDPPEDAVIGRLPSMAVSLSPQQPRIANSMLAGL